jgi:low temperature requirement protein LtrA
MTTARQFFPRPKVSTEGHRVTTFELLFDLVFVFAFTQVTHFMAHSHSAIGVLQAVVILAILWWSWNSYAWLANQTHVDEGIVRLGMCVALLAMFVVALAIPEAFEDLEGGLNGPLVLVAAYFTVRLIHGLLYLIAAGDDHGLRRQVLRSGTAMVSGTALILVGAIVGGPWQTWLWLAGIALDILLTYLTSAGGDWRIQSPAHFAERYGLIVMLALGESVVSIGAGAAQKPLSGPILLGAALAVLLTLAMWWLYFDGANTAGEHHLAKATGVARANLGTDAYTYLHFFVITGIIISALGVEQVIERVTEAEPLGLFTACALFGGTSLYLAGHALFWRRISGKWATLRLVGGLVLLALIPVGAGMAPLPALGIAVLVTVANAASDLIKYRGQRSAMRELDS